METTPALFLANGLTEESWTVVVARRMVPWPDTQRGEFLRDTYTLAWLRAGASNYEDPPAELCELFSEEIVTFTTALTLKGVLNPGSLYE